MKRKLFICLILLSTLLSTPAMSNLQLGIALDIDEVPAFREAIFAPFISKGKIPVSENTIDSEAISFPKEIPPYIHVITLNKDTLKQGCDSGKLVKLIETNFPHRDLLNNSALEECGLGYSVASTVLAYSIIHKYGTPPNDWSAFFDTNRYPGKRALPMHARGVLEAALLADGVRSQNLYKELSTDEGIERAFAKLDSLRGSLVWWDQAKELRSWLIDGDIALAIALDGTLLSEDGKHNINVIRNQAIYKMRYFAIPINANNQRLAYSFISFATQANQQKELMGLMPYGLSLKQGWMLLSKDDRRYTTNYPQNLANGILEDYNFYLTYGKTIEDKYKKWRLSNAPKIERVTVSPFNHNKPVNKSKIEVTVPDDEAIEDLQLSKDIAEPQ